MKTSRCLALLVLLGGCSQEAPTLAPIVRFEGRPLDVAWDSMPERAPERNAEAERAVADGERRLNTGDALAGVALLRRAVDLRPGSAPLRLKLAAGFERIGDPDAALVVLREAVRIAPRDAAASFAVGRILAHTGTRRDAAELDEAIAALRRVRDLAPSSNEAVRASTMLKMLTRLRDKVAPAKGAPDPGGKTGTAAPKRATEPVGLPRSKPSPAPPPQDDVALDPDDAVVAGNALLERGSPRDAARAYGRALVARPNDVQLRWLLGLAHLRAGDRSAAAATWKPLADRGALDASQRTMWESVNAKR